MSKISLKHSGGNVVSLNAPTNAPGAADVAFKLPNNDGSDGQALVTDGSGNLSFGNVAGGSAKNLIINGAMQVAQRATTNNTTGAQSAYHTLDRYMTQIQAGTITESQQDLATSDTPYTLGFRKYMRLLNQSGVGAGANQYIEIDQRIEAQNVAQSGWNYTSSSSFITLSFWVRASVAQSYIAVVYSNDGTQRHYPFEIKDSGGSTLSANTWTKITKTIPGDSGITVNNDIGNGLTVSFIVYYGTTYTSSSGTLNAWNTTGSGLNRWPDMTTTWATTTNATFDITGVQLEVGSTASDFAHETFGETLQKCHRYFFSIGDGVNGTNIAQGIKGSATSARYTIYFPVTMRTAPTFTYNSLKVDSETSGSYRDITSVQSAAATTISARLALGCDSSAGQGSACTLLTDSTSSYLRGHAEL